MKQFVATSSLAFVLMVGAILAPAALSSRAAAESWEAIPPNPDVDIVYIPHFAAVASHTTEAAAT